MVLTAAAATLGGSIASSLLGGAFGLASNALGASQQQAYSKELMRYQSSLNSKTTKDSTINQWSWNREGLEKAGYNPLLAVQNNATSANGNFASAQQGANPNYGSAIANFADLARLENETASTRAQVLQSNSEALLNQKKEEELAITNENLARKLKKELAVMQAQKYFYDNSAYNQQQQGLWQGYNAQTSRISANAQANANDVAYELGMANLPPTWARTLGGIVGSGVGAGLGIYGAFRGMPTPTKFKPYKPSPRYIPGKK
ncbi:MAG: hypothetical protein NC200_06800 [Candidatus Gastranaerophilales bacterium]|nr:hypothetical protein [Candidatus Gastranaerophilales bacterium]